MKQTTIIVCTLNRPEFLRRALASIKAQTCTDWQVVIVNDGGIAAEVEAVASASGFPQDALRVIHHSVSKGRAAACNAAIQASEGEYITALDDDDTWHPDFLRRCLACMAGQKIGSACRGVVTRTILVKEQWLDGHGREKSRRPFNPKLTEVRLADLTMGNRFTDNAFLYRRDALPEVGFYDESLPVLEDWEFNVRFAARFAIAVIPEYLAYYHQRVGQTEGSAANSDPTRHREQMQEIKSAWLRADLAAGRFGLGALALQAEIESNRGLRLFNRLASWFGR